MRRYGAGMANPFDPLRYLERELYTRVRLNRETGELVPEYDTPSRVTVRDQRRIRAVLYRYGDLLRLQLAGERPRSVRKLIALNLVRIERGRYVLQHTNTGG